MATHSSILAWRIHGQRRPVGYSPRGCKELDTTERLSVSLFSWRRGEIKTGAQGVSGHLWSTQTTADLNHGCFSGTVEKDEVVCWKDSTEMHCIGQDIPGKPQRASDTLCFFIASSSPVRPLGPATPSPAPDIPCFGLQPKAIGMFF